MIEGVEHVDADLQFHFLDEREVLGKAEIEIPLESKDSART